MNNEERLLSAKVLSNEIMKLCNEHNLDDHLTGFEVAGVMLTIGLLMQNNVIGVFSTEGIMEDIYADQQ